MKKWLILNIIIILITLILSITFANFCFLSEVPCIINKYKNSFTHFIIFSSFSGLLFIILFKIVGKLYKNIILSVFIVVLFFIQVLFNYKNYILNTSEKYLYLIENDLIFSEKTLKKHKNTYNYKNDSCVLSIGVKYAKDLNNFYLHIKVNNLINQKKEYFFDLKINSIESVKIYNQKIKSILILSNGLLSPKYPNVCNCEDYLINNDMIELYQDSMLLFYNMKSLKFE